MTPPRRGPRARGVGDRLRRWRGHAASVAALWCACVLGCDSQGTGSDPDQPPPDAAPDAAVSVDASTPADADAPAEQDAHSDAPAEQDAHSGAPPLGLNALFVGNSFIAVNDVAPRYQALTGAPRVVAVAPGGYQLAQHAADAQDEDSRLARLLASGDLDVVW